MSESNSLVVKDATAVAIALFSRLVKGFLLDRADLLSLLTGSPVNSGNSPWLSVGRPETWSVSHRQPTSGAVYKVI